MIDLQIEHGSGTINFPALDAFAGFLGKQPASGSHEVAQSLASPHQVFAEKRFEDMWENHAPTFPPAAIPTVLPMIPPAISSPDFTTAN